MFMGVAIGIIAGNVLLEASNLLATLRATSLRLLKDIRYQASLHPLR